MARLNAASCEKNARVGLAAIRMATLGIGDSIDLLHTRLQRSHDTFQHRLGQVCRNRQSDDERGNPLGDVERVVRNVVEMRLLEQPSSVPQAKLDIRSREAALHAIGLVGIRTAEQRVTSSDARGAEETGCKTGRVEPRTITV